ncbi:MAG TPA: transglycosylase family protein [Thermoleophilaceae bacterium]|nr:transglycosylase family protein [Thermoleophilaceae bacterium]
MRKLFPVPVLACLLAAPTAFGAPGHQGAQGDPALITASLGNDPLDGAEARGRVRAAERSAKRAAAVTRAAREAPPVAVPPQLEAIAACESGGNPQAVSAGGDYRGKYQFSPATWQAVGGSGDPAAATEAEQDRRAALLYARSGGGQWPTCGAGE